MQINDMIAQMGGLGAIAQQLGVSESQAADPSVNQWFNVNAFNRVIYELLRTVG